LFATVGVCTALGAHLLLILGVVGAFTAAQRAGRQMGQQGRAVRAFPAPLAVGAPGQRGFEQPVALAEVQRTRGAVLASTDYDISGPVTQGNLSVYLIKGPDTLKRQRVLSLQNAVTQNLAVIHAGLTIDNRANVPIFIQAGDIVKGGTQDRTLPYDMLVPAGAQNVPLMAFCVEAGRSGRARERSAPPSRAPPSSSRASGCIWRRAIGMLRAKSGRGCATFRISSRRTSAARSSRRCRRRACS